MKKRNKCIVCEGDMKFARKSGGKQENAVRPNGSHTCSRRCSKIYTRIYRLIYRRTINVLVKELKEIKSLQKKK